MEISGGATTGSWTETAEDLIHNGAVEKAISFLESIVSNLEHRLQNEPPLQDKNGGKKSASLSTADQLYTALRDLSKLYADQGLSIQADQTLSRALQIKHTKWGLRTEKESTFEEFAEVSQNGYDGNYSNSQSDGIAQHGGEDDDWEAVADRAPEELLSPQGLPGVSKLSLEDSKAQSTKRRGRGTFAYKKKGLYSDNQSDDEPVIDDSEDSSVCHDEDVDKRDLIYGTRHVLVLADFPSSTRTTELEKILEKFKNRFVIRWVNDTTSLAVFRTPSVALEASNSIQCPFTVRVLSEDDEILSSIPTKDLEPPRQRPQTSARTAQRLIAQSMGIKLPSNFGSSELRKQEEARKSRIVSRQNMRDDAWGDDGAN